MEVSPPPHSKSRAAAGAEKGAGRRPHDAGKPKSKSAVHPAGLGADRPAGASPAAKGVVAVVDEEAFVPKEAALKVAYDAQTAYDVLKQRTAKALDAGNAALEVLKQQYQDHYTSYIQQLKLRAAEKLAALKAEREAARREVVVLHTRMSAEAEALKTRLEALQQEKQELEAAREAATQAAAAASEQHEDHVKTLSAAHAAAIASTEKELEDVREAVRVGVVVAWMRLWQGGAHVVGRWGLVVDVEARPKHHPQKTPACKRLLVRSCRRSTCSPQPQWVYNRIRRTCRSRRSLPTLE